MIHGKSLVTTCPVGTSTIAGTVMPLRVGREAREVGLLESLDPEHRVDPVRGRGRRSSSARRGSARTVPSEMTSSRPSSCAHDDRPAGPRAGPRRDQPVAAGLDRPERYVARSVLRRPAPGGDPVGDVVLVPLELTAGLLAVVLVHPRGGTRVVERRTSRRRGNGSGPALSRCALIRRYCLRAGLVGSRHLDDLAGLALLPGEQLDLGPDVGGLVVSDRNGDSVALLGRLDLLDLGVVDEER